MMIGSLYDYSDVTLTSHVEQEKSSDLPLCLSLVPTIGTGDTLSALVGVSLVT